MGKKLHAPPELNVPALTASCQVNQMLHTGNATEVIFIFDSVVGAAMLARGLLAIVGTACFVGLIAAGFRDPQANWAGSEVKSPRIVYLFLEGLSLVWSLAMGALNQPFVSLAAIQIPAVPPRTTTI